MSLPRKQNIASLNTEAADEIAGLKEHGANLAETIKDLVAIMKQIASLGGNIGDLRAAIDNLQVQLDRTKNYSTSIP